MLARYPRLVLLLVTALLLALTLTPVSGPGSGSISFDIIGFRGIADALVNVLLFIPFGAAAAACFTGKARPVLAGAVLSLVIESAQLMVPGRFVSPADVTFNTTGAALGM
ncbi:MAG: VanZ family protein, partial [Longimicrobiales bacterium]